MGIYNTPDPDRPGQETSKYGIWENGRRILWLNDKQVAEIKEAKKDYREYFNESGSSNLVDANAGFEVPIQFDANIEQIVKRVKQKYDQNH